MGIRVFEGCAGLTSVRMPEGITTLSDYLFSGCMALREVKFSSSLKATGAYTFEN